MSETKWMVCAGDATYVYVGTAKPIACGSKERARLIAAAPEMAEALRYLIEECDPSMDDDYNPHAAPLALARAALAKAEGRTP